jgi:protein-S-isoprenylcysteine O-methyltransferase Ste14
MAAWRWRNVPLPERHVGAIAAGVALGFFLPWRLWFTPWLGHLLGWPLVMVGVALGAWSVWAAGQEDLERSASLVVRGPYEFSRNPMYLAWHLLYAGIAFVLGAAWLLVLLPIVLLLTHLVIRGEEARLDSHHGEMYREYRGRVRRYL